MNYLQRVCLTAAFLLAFTTACRNTEPSVSLAPVSDSNSTSSVSEEKNSSSSLSVIPSSSVSSEAGMESTSQNEPAQSTQSAQGEVPQPVLNDPAQEPAQEPAQTSLSPSPEIQIPEKSNYGGFLENPSAPYMEITFEGVTYPDSISMAALRDGKLYFSYRNDPSGDTGKERFDKNLHESFSYGIYDLALQTTQLLTGGNFLNQGNQIICTSGESLLMPNGILYQQGASAKDGCVTYITDFSGNGETRILAQQTGDYLTPIAHLRAIDSQRFVMNFRDYGGTYDSLYLYDISKSSPQLILERQNVDTNENTPGEWNCAFDVWGENIWCYYAGNGKDSRHYLRRYNLNGGLEEELPIPESVTSYKSWYVNGFVPANMFCLSENTFFAPYAGNNMGFLFKIENGTVVTKPVPEREQLRYMIPNTIEKADFAYFIDRDNCSLVQLNTDTLEFRSLKMNVIDPEHLAFLKVISDTQGNVIVQDLLTYIDSPSKESSVHYYYIPYTTISQFSTVIN